MNCWGPLQRLWFALRCCQHLSNVDSRFQYDAIFALGMRRHQFQNVSHLVVALTYMRLVQNDRCPTQDLGPFLRCLNSIMCTWPVFFVVQVPPRGRRWKYLFQQSDADSFAVHCQSKSGQSRAVHAGSITMAWWGTTTNWWWVPDQAGKWQPGPGCFEDATFTNPWARVKMFQTQRLTDLGF